VKRWLAVVPIVVLVLLGVLFAAYGLKHDPHVIPEAMVGKPVPALSLPRLDTGAKEPLKAHIKGLTLINVFASWCAPCIEEAPALMALKAEGVPIIGIAYKDRTPATRAFLGRLGDPFDVVLQDNDGAAGVEFGISGVPETFAVDERGKILAKHAGQLTPEAAEKLLDAARKAR
jgi:cytochrome c biogenesis protein CcmG/thiol:disulfide interchange protein DsbE